MANSLLVTNEQAINRAELLQTTLLNSVLRLLQNYTPAMNDNRAVLLANEANFTGYPAGGYNLTAWVGPALPGTGGASITSILVNVVPAGNNVIVNNISGFWVETPPTANVTYLTGVFSPFIPVQNTLSQFPIVVQDFEGVAIAPI